MSAMGSAMDQGIEAQIREWRAYLLRRQSLHYVDVDELEDHLRNEMSQLGAAGLSGDESFLVAIKRLGGVHELSREFARERSSRLWKQLMLSGDSARGRSGFAYLELAAVAAIAVAAAAAFKLPVLSGIDPWSQDGSDADALFYLRNLSLLVLPFLLGFFAWRQALPAPVIAGLAVPFAAAAVVINAYPFTLDSDTLPLAIVHLAVFLWLVAGVAYLGGAWRDTALRMDFVRFTGEWLIYYALVAIGGGVLMAMTLAIFDAIGIDVERAVTAWVLPCGAVGAVIVVAWLVEAKQSVVENMAPVLTAVFTPLFALLLVAAIAGMVLTANFVDADRDLLIVFDLVLVVVLGLVLYSISARSPDATPTLMDAVQLVLVACALLLDLFALAAMIGRIVDFGFTANRTAGLGLNLVLLVNLAWTACLLAAFQRGRRPYAALERWQTVYIPVYALWALVVVVVFPPLFDFA